MSAFLDSDMTAALAVLAAKDTDDRIRKLVDQIEVELKLCQNPSDVRETMADVRSALAIG